MLFQNLSISFSIDSFYTDAHVTFAPMHPNTVMDADVIHALIIGQMGPLSGPDKQQSNVFFIPWLTFNLHFWMQGRT